MDSGGKVSTITRLLLSTQQRLKKQIRELQAEPPMHPYFITSLILLHYFASTQLMQFPIDMIAVPLIGSCVYVFITWAFLGIALNDAEKAGLMTTAAVLIFFSLLIMGPLAPYVPDFLAIIEPFWLIMVVGMVAALVTRRGWFRASTVLNHLSASACLMFCAVLACWESYNYVVRLPQFIHADAEIDAQPPIVVSEKPDIYYIIIDACASDAVLRKLYGADQSAYSKTLTEMGFKVVPQSHSNYAMTLLSLASFLNMEYVNQLEQLIGPKIIDFSINNIIIRQNRIAGMLKKRGYKIVQVSSGFGPTWWNPWADYNLHSAFFSESVFSVFQRSLYGIISQRSLIDRLADLRLSGFANVKKSVSIPGPKFVFAHILLPHPPFLFDASGDRLNARASMNFTVDDQEHDRKLYVAQTEFAKRSAIDAIKYILKHSKRPPIIVLQSDHGPGTYGDIYFHTMPNDTFIEERLGNYNALYLPGVSRDIIPDDLTPVNSFRIIFNNYFGTKYPLLKNKIYVSSYATPFNFIDVTDKLLKH